MRHKHETEIQWFDWVMEQSDAPRLEAQGAKSYVI